MAAFKDVRDIKAWQLANQLRLRVDLFLLSPQFKYQYRFCDELSDAVRSGPRHIAEGFARDQRGDFARFVRAAKASEVKVLGHLLTVRDQHLITPDEFVITAHVTRRAINAARGLIRRLEAQGDH